MILEQKICLRNVMTLEQKQASLQRQKQRVGLAACLSLELRAPVPPNTKMERGIEGLLFADEILQRKGLIGIVIGGIARAFWSRTNGVEDFLRKDVDVLVFPKGDKPIKFSQKEEGIDWWIPRKKHISFNDGTASRIEGDFLFFENRNGVILNFVVTESDYSEPGLYMLDLNQLITLQFAEASAVLGNSINIFEDYEKHMRRKYQKVSSKHMIDSFKDKFISKLIFDELTPRAISAIKSK